MASNPSHSAADATQDPAPSTKQDGKYLLFLAAAIMICLGGMGLVNCVVDPLWYFKGNTLTGMNLVLDERTSKPTRLAGLEPKPDCLLFGTSSGSLMNHTQPMAGTDCFNLAVSKGHSDEFAKLADWAKAQGVAPRTVVFEVDAISLMATPPSVSLPDFVVKKEAPPSPFVSYISFRALLFSAKTVLNMQSNPRYYDRQFNGAVVKTPPYDPTKDHSFMGSLGPYDAKGNLDAIKTFRSNWPGVKVICYAAPFSPDFAATIEQRGTLNSFTNAMWAIAKSCDSFRDFNIPSDITANPNLTYDGIHYTPETNARFAASFTNNGDFAWSDISGLSPEQYLKVYQTAIARVEKAAGRQGPEKAK